MTWWGYLFIAFGIGLLLGAYWRMIVNFGELFSRLGAVEQAVATLKKSRDDETIEAVTGVLTDPDRLDAELDRAGELSEMRRARRRHLPRENAGPPAKVRRMKFTR